MTDRQWDHVRREHQLLSNRHQPLMSECHLIDMDNDVRNRARILGRIFPQWRGELEALLHPTRITDNAEPDAAAREDEEG